jgi:uncharacterized lipoprotein YddW (UPF0748 family)
MLALLAAVAAAACGPARSAARGGELLPESGPPPVQREFRGVWVATVANIDWPSARGLPPEQQRAELLGILDRAAELNLNAVILQVRPAADALYASDIETWSEYLSGEAGQGPEPGYDPLEFAVAEAHRRGLELHAWFNPYRARHTSATGSIPESHISRSRPDLVWTYGRHLWMDPGEPEVQDRTVEVVLDVMRRYDVDGIHLDDYFYPYRERDLHGNLLPFPDSATFARYRGAGGTLDLHDWRRHNVDVLVERLYREIKAEKPWVKFGISPFGVWRPGHPRGIGGFDAYAELYADARKWLANGWLDYITPQLYWPISRADVSYPILLRWWIEQNDRERHVWPGNFTNRWSADEIVGQVFVTRGMPGASGNVHFSARTLMQSADSVGERLAAAAYGEPALIPASPWLGSGRPGRPEVAFRQSEGGAEVLLTPAASGDPWLWTIRTLGADGWSTDIAPGWTRTHDVEIGAAMVVVTAVSRAGVESDPVVLDRSADAGARASNLPVSRP